MNGPGGRATPGIDAAIGLLARGADRPQVLRETRAAAQRASHATHALLLGSKIGGPVVLAAIGTGCSSLEVATAEALSGGPSGRSDPVARVNAAAVPVWAGSRVVAALGVAGPDSTLDPTPLDTAVDLVALAFSRAGRDDTLEAVCETFPALVEVSDRDQAARAALEALRRVVPVPALVCVEEEGRIRVASFHGLERERLSTLVGDEQFRMLVRQWRETAPEGAEVLPTSDGSDQIGCVPIAGERWHGLIALVGTDAEVKAGIPTATAIAGLTAQGLHRVAVVDAGRARADDMARLINALPDPIVIVDADGNLVKANPPAIQALGISEEFDRGRPVLQRFDAPELDAAIARGEGDCIVTPGQPPRQHSVLVRSLGGGERVVAFTDIASADERSRMTEEFVSVMGHELRTPLTVVKGSLQTVTEFGERVGDDERSTLLSSALRHANHLEQLIEDLLLMSTESAGRPSLTYQAADAADIAEHVMTIAREQAPDRSLELLHLGGDTTLTTDEKRLAQALRHLVMNGLKHTDGPVTLELKGDADAVDIAVTDQGPGIFSEALDRMFEPFVQGDSSSTRQTGGTGIGLFIARRLVEAMGGRLGCDSRLGQGSRFEMRLPKTPPKVTVNGSGSMEVTAARDHASS